jgi:hypothetical protein
MAKKQPQLAKGEKPQPEKRPRGGQTIYTREIADEICKLMSEGATLNQICRRPGMPSRPTVLNWALEDRDGFSDRYARARDHLIDHWADEAMDIADDSSNDFIEREQQNGDSKVVANREAIERSRLRVDTRKWMLTKLKPQRYGDKVDLKHDAGDAFLQLWQGMSGGKPRSD